MYISNWRYNRLISFMMALLKQAGESSSIKFSLNSVSLCGIPKKKRRLPVKTTLKDELSSKVGLRQELVYQMTQRAGGTSYNFPKQNRFILEDICALSVNIAVIDKYRYKSHLLFRSILEHSFIVKKLIPHS